MTPISFDLPTPTLLDAEALLRLAPVSSPVFLVLDYDGTLVPFKDIPDQASPDPELLDLLRNLSARPDRFPSIVTGRSRVQVEKWFGSLPIGLYAEHGVWCKRSGDEAWCRAVEPVDAWPPDIVDAIKKASDMLPGSLLEVKSASLTFHYRAVRRHWVASTVPWLRCRLASLAQQYSLRLIKGAESLELRAPGVTTALAARVILARVQPGAAVLAFADDATDEDMFGALPCHGLSVHVGSGQSTARYAINGPQEVRRFLSML